MSNRIQIRRGTSNDWETTNIILSTGELGFDIEKNILKIGDGITPWNDLEQFGAGASVEVGSTAPLEPEVGNLWFDSNSGSLFIYFFDGVTNGWIEASGSTGVANITIKESAPSNPNPGELWWNSETGILYIYYEDETSGQWVDATYGTALNLIASDIEYDNQTSGLTAEDVQDALDEIQTNKLDTSDLISLESDLIPNTDITYDLGSTTKRWKDLYLSGNTIVLGDTVLKSQQDGRLGIFGADGSTPSTFSIANGSIADDLLSDSSGQIKDKVSSAEGRLDTIEGDNQTEGSIAKALQDAKDYTDISKLGFGNNYAVADLTERDALQDLVIGDLVFVADNGDGKWAQYKITNDDPITFLKIMDQDVLINALDAAGIKSAYESNPDTNAFTDSLLSKLNNIEDNAKDDQNASEVDYDNTTSELTATNLKDAIDELDSNIESNASNITAVENRLDVVEGDNTTEGSIAKALQDAKDYSDNFAKVEFFNSTVNGSEGASDWSLESGGTFDGAYKAVITVSGILLDDAPIIDLDLENVNFSDWEDYESSWALIKYVEATANNELTLFASEEPAKSLDFVVKVVR